MISHCSDCTGARVEKAARDGDGRMDIGLLLNSLGNEERYEDFGREEGIGQGSGVLKGHNDAFIRWPNNVMRKLV